MHRRTEGHLREVVFDGADKASPAPGVIEAITEANAVVLTPSNPLVSVGPILSVPGSSRVRSSATPARVVAVSPLVGGRTLKGPADRMLRDQGMEANAVSIARLYQDFLDVLVIDDVDADLEASDRSAWSRGSRH